MPKRNCLECLVRGENCFCRLPAQALVELQQIGRSVTLQKGERVLDEGDLADKVFLVCAGHLKLVTSSAEGRVLLLRIANPGDALGLASTLQGSHHQVAAEALGPCVLKAIRRADFLGFLQHFGEASRNALDATATEYEGALLSARRLALSGSAAGKLANLLLEWGQVESHGPATFAIPLTHEELGSMAGLSRETVTRLLAQFRRDGWLEQTDGGLTLLQPEKLRSLYS